MFMCTDEDYKKINSMVPFYRQDRHASKLCEKNCHYWAADYFHSYLNQMPKPLSHSLIF